MNKIKLKIIILSIISLCAIEKNIAQTTNEIKADLFYKITDKLIFIGEASKIEYRIATYGCSKDFNKALNYFKPKGIFKDKKFTIRKVEYGFNPAEYDYIIVAQTKNSELPELYTQILNATKTGTSITIFTNNWKNKTNIVFNFVIEKNSDIVSFEYNLENLTKFNVSAEQEISQLNGIDLSARKMLDKTQRELKKTEQNLKEKEKDLAKTIKEAQIQQTKINTQKKQLTEQQKLIEKKQTEITTQQQKLQKLATQMQETKKRLNIQQQNIDKKELELRKAQQEMIEFQIKITEIQKHFNEQTTELNEKTKELNEKNSKINKVNQQIELKKKELGDLNNTVKYQRLALIAFAFLILIIIILTIWVFRSYKKMQEQNKKMQEQNKILEHQNREIEAQADELEKANLELEKLSIVASNTNNAVAILDENGKFDWLNAGFTKMYGYTLQLLKNELNENIEKNNIYKNITETYKKVTSTKQSAYFEHETQTRKQKTIWIQTAISPIINHKGQLKQTVLIDSDITKIKIAEQQIAKQNANIKNSILYASRIQKATLPSKKILNSHIPNNFVLYLPRDIVSGDFYWSAKINEKTLFAAADCTGHGVPGAFMSMLGITLLNEIITTLPNNKIQPNNILNELRTKLIIALRQTKEETSNKDGIAISLCMKEKNTLTFAGAENQMVLARKNEIITYEADDMLIGLERKTKPFTNKNVKYEKNDMIYLFSDGYVDQFGGPGPRRKKFLIKRLRDLFSQIHNKPLTEQHNILLNTHTKWKGKNNQIDDIIIMGIQM